MILKKKRILAIEEGINSEKKNKKTKRQAAISKKARFTPLKVSNEQFKISYDILNGSSFN